MSLSKITVLDQVEVTRSGVIHIRLGLLVVDGTEEIACEWHRTSLPPGANLGEQIDAVNAHLCQMNKAPVEDVSMLIKVVGAVHTPDLIAAYRKRQQELAEKFDPTINIPKQAA